MGSLLPLKSWIPYAVGEKAMQGQQAAHGTQRFLSNTPLDAGSYHLLE
jgi:hypothetical protein